MQQQLQKIMTEFMDNVLPWDTFVFAGSPLMRNVDPIRKPFAWEILGQTFLHRSCSGGGLYCDHVQSCLAVCRW